MFVSGTRKKNNFFSSHFNEFVLFLRCVDVFMYAIVQCFFITSFFVRGALNYVKKAFLHGFLVSFSSFLWYFTCFFSSFLYVSDERKFKEESITPNRARKKRMSAEHRTKFVVENDDRKRNCVIEEIVFWWLLLLISVVVDDVFSHKKSNWNMFFIFFFRYSVEELFAIIRYLSDYIFWRMLYVLYIPSS